VREEKEKKIKKKNSDTYRNFNDNIISNIGKILTKQIQKYQKKSPTVNGMSYTHILD